MDDVYAFSDVQLSRMIGSRLKSARLQQNKSQQSLAEDAQVSISTVKKVESGEIGSFESFVRVLRTLGKLDVLEPLVEEEDMSPNEYFEFVSNMKRRCRKRASSVAKQEARKEVSEW